MKHTCLVLAFLIFVGASFAVRAQNSTADESGHILALETAWNHALEVKDTAALQMLLSNSMVALDSDGVLMSKAAFLAGIKAPDYKPGQVVNEKIAVHMFGDTAVVAGVYRERNIENGKPVVNRASFVDTWVKQGGTWQCVASTAVTIPSKASSGN
ncbi:MAG TPA: nuclear transport factor 2 family protein [Candidatus Eisenbacteria bacterium]|nr:nuclear transport factor 2 family protein [Candidatus Eisenbacteria bacterium]